MRSLLHSLLCLPAFAVVAAAIVVLTTAPVWADAPFFQVPYDATLYLSALGGEAGAVTEFGLGTSPADAFPVFTGLPNDPMPPGEVGLGFFPVGSELNFYEKTDFGDTGWAFSSDTTTDASRVAFMDQNNLLGLGGSIVEPTGSDTWNLHLDDALSYLFDDDNNDVLIQLRLAPVVPEPSTGVLATLGLLGVIAPIARVRKGWIALAAVMVVFAASP